MIRTCPFWYNALMIEKAELIDLYTKKGYSVSVIAKRLGCSEHKVNYWIHKQGISKRTISDAIYKKWNPRVDPFFVTRPKTLQEAVLYGMGIGLYWGEGTKANKMSVRLGNSDPALIKTFVSFLVKFYGINKHKLRFGLQIFGDMDADSALHHWENKLRVSRKQFYPKVIITPHRGVGNYRQKTKFGVLTVYFNNKKLRDIICRAIDEESMR